MSLRVRCGPLRLLLGAEPRRCTCRAVGKGAPFWSSLPGGSCVHSSVAAGVAFLGGEAALGELGAGAGTASGGSVVRGFPCLRGPGTGTSQGQARRTSVMY